MTMEQAYDMLPASAEWSCSFGNVGDERFTEMYRTPHGQRFEIGHVYGEWFCRELGK